MLLNLNMTGTTLGIAALTTFIAAYLLVISEEFTELRKSKPVILAAGLIWFFVAIAAKSVGVSEIAQTTMKHAILEYSELFLFLMVAMTFVNAIEERQVFEALKAWLVQKQFTYRQLFWITGFCAFFLSPIADNMTTSLIMCAIIMAVGQNKPSFVVVSCINIVVAANAGGAFCPFGDITTLMVWQKGIIPFEGFFQLFFPCLVNFILPAILMQTAVPNTLPTLIENKVPIAKGGIIIVALFLLTIAITVFFNHFFRIPAAIGMTTGLALLQFYSYFLNKAEKSQSTQLSSSEPIDHFDIFNTIKRVEWDTLLFFYGVMLCVGGLAAFGYLHIASSTLYENLGSHFSQMHQQTPANVILGVLSAIVDNIPLMYAVLTVEPAMSEGQWLLITLTTGVGGSLLSIGSAAGVALMGQSKGQYTFLSHLKWSWAILLGYFASIGTHLLINQSLF